MADKTTNSYELKFVLQYDDDDTRTESIPNPKADITDPSTKETTRTKLNAFGAITIGDKASGNFVRTKTAYVVEKAITELDLTNITPPSA